MSRFACVRVPFFAAAAVERCEPSLVERALAVTRGAPPMIRVVDASAPARERGVEPGMTEAEARARCPSLVTRPDSEERVASARHALLEAVLGVSPRIEDAAPGLVYADLTGLERLVGEAAAIGRRLARQARAVGLPAGVGIAGTRTAARIVACLSRGEVTVVPPGGERAAIAGAPLAVLDLPPGVEDIFAQWGIATLGDLAALPREGLAARLGAAGLRARDAAQGIDREPFHVWTAPPLWQEAQDLEWEIDSLVGLAAVLDRVLERLSARLGAAGVAVDRLDVSLQLASRARHERRIGLAYPTREVGLLRVLIMHDLERHPPDAPVAGVALAAHAVRPEPAPGRLGQPPGPAHRDLAALLARLAALVGSDNVGAAVPADSHRPDAFTIVPFAVPVGAGTPWPEGVADDGRLVLRRSRPPRPLEVETVGGRPVRVWAAGGSEGGATRRTVLAAAGPWRISGEWWDTRAWARDEWDLLLDDGTLCRLAHDRLAGRWLFDGIYD